MSATLGVQAPTTRDDAIAKVTGEARYAAEFHLDRRAYGAVVQATVARGRVRSVEVSGDGVLHVLTHDNAPRLHRGDDTDPETLVLQDDVVHYRGQIVALVVAATLEQARAAADGARVEYDEEPHDVVLTRDHEGMYTPEKVNPAFPSTTETGDVDAALASAVHVVDEVYETPAEHNNPMEPHAATATWEGGRLVVHDSNQGVASVAQALGGLFELESGDVRVLAGYVGGGFGAKGSLRPPAVLAAMASRVTERPVTVVATRQQMFAYVGYRTPTIQRMRLGADADGRLTALEHTAWEQTSTVMEFAEQTAVLSRVLYATPNVRTGHRLVALDVPTPRWMRAPGEAPGSFALESAIDELAERSGVDPVELRLRNDTDREPEGGLPFTSRALAECLRVGAERFGWSGRDARPGVHRVGRWLVGTGVGVSLYPARSAPATATATAHPDGSFTVEIAAADIGTGARTVLRQIAAEALATDPAQVRVDVADSTFGPAMIAGGSMGTTSWSWAVTKACRELRERVAVTPSEAVSVRADTSEDIQAMDQQWSRHSFGAQFAQVRVDTDTGEIRVPRLLGVFGAGRIVNPTTARSQLIGGMTMGLGMALHEESVMDAEFGDYLNHDLAGYHVPVNADVGSIEVDWVDERDERVNPLGIKGIGEVGIVGTAAAIANAVWHATGVRFRTLPLVPSRVLPAIRRRTPGSG